MTPMSNKAERKLQRKLDLLNLEEVRPEKIMQASLSLKIKPDLTSDLVNQVVLGMIWRMSSSVQLLFLRTASAGKKVIREISYDRSSGVAILFGTWGSK